MKISVRKKALQKLLEVYRDYCKKCSESEMTICDHFEQIPCKILLLCYDKDCKEFRFAHVHLKVTLLKSVFIMLNLSIIEIFQVPKHWANSCGGFVSCSWNWGEYKALGAFVFSFHLSSCEGSALYFISETKVFFTELLLYFGWKMLFSYQLWMFSGYELKCDCICLSERKRRYSA